MRNIGDFTEMHNGKKSIWKKCVNSIVSVIGTRVTVYQNFVNVAALLASRQNGPNKRCRLRSEKS